MIMPAGRVRIMLATRPIDFRKGHNSLAAEPQTEGHHQQAGQALKLIRGDHLREPTTEQHPHQA